MKKSPASVVIWPLALILLTQGSLQGQTFERRWALSLGGGALRYTAPVGEPTLVNPAWSGAGQISADRYLNGGFDFRARLTVSPSVAFPTSAETFANTSLWDMHYQLVLKANNGIFMRQNALIGPFAAVGFGGSFAQARPDAYLPLSGGFRVRVNDRVALRFESMKKFSLNRDFQNVVHAVAFVYNLDTRDARPSQQMPEQDLDRSLVSAPLPNDWDADGIPDWLDECPQEAGFIHLNGCPAEDETQTLLADATPAVNDAPSPALPAQAEEKQTDRYADASRQALPLAPGMFPYIPYPEDEPFEQGQLAILATNKPAEPKSKSQTEWANASQVLPELPPSPVAPLSEPVVSRSGAEVKKMTTDALPGMATYPDHGPCGKPGSSSAAGAIYFDPGADKLPNSAYPVLLEIAEQMKACGDMRLLISGHADPSGNQRDNLVLSIMRAYNVKYYLVYQHGIPQSRITSRGFGADAALIDQKPDAEAARRVDFELVY